jgi:putative peptide zinc metalloprotease protein
MSRQIFSSSWHNVANLRPRLLSHCRLYRHVYRGQSWFVLQDAAGSGHYRLSAAAHAIVSKMDGRHTLDELWNDVFVANPEDIPTQDELVQLLGQLHAANLLHCDVTPDSAELFERYQQRRKAKWKQWLGNPMSMRIPLIDPDKFLGALLKRLPWVFSATGGVLWLLMVLPALALAIQHWGELTENAADRILSSQNLFLMALLYVPIKALHELGHGLATKTWGGPVHEMGIMFLVFAPVPYIDSSTASSFYSKYRRAIVGAAGMMVELVLAALAMYVWLMVEPGILRAIAFNIMLVAGISTLVVNGNPLLRYDGYYILADLIEMPNLAQRGKTYCTWLCDRYLFKAQSQEPPAESPSEQRWLVPYTLLSWLYRNFVTVSIILFVAKKFFIFGIVLALWGGFTLLALPLWKCVKHVTSSPSLHQRRSQAVRFAAIATLVIVAIGALVPLPLRTRAQGVIWLEDDSLVRAQSNGFFVHWLATPGSHVKVGDSLLIMSDEELDAQLEADKARVAEAEAKYDAEAFTHPAQAGVISEQLEQARRKLALTAYRHARLVVTAQSNGVLTAPEYQDMTGKHYRKGELLGYVIDPSKLIARVVVSQDNIDLVRTRMAAVQMRTRDTINRTFSSKVIREFPGAVNEVPSAALTSTGGGELAADPSDQNGQKIFDRVFMLDLALPAGVKADFLCARVEVRFIHMNEPLFAQLYRRVRQLFLSRLNV